MCSSPFCFDLTYEGLKFSSWNAIKSSPVVLILPMRDWNAIAAASPTSVRYVLILPMRDWNYSTSRICSAEFQVLILPMRDWNISRRIQSSWRRKSFDLTYEGLKSGSFPYNLSSMSPCFDLTYEGLKLSTKQKKINVKRRVLILPMRDWNLKHKLTVSTN